ncbi:MAG: hypothetical protein A2383_02425 [Candidatus Pacebacteria bacterium RIFOXYB1_FULL_39_46]|nr:MAG: hypothetical protein A2383_02425 [Candidatus Pacebacteria bacterium RIFOXYB1_FULL_39_46]
MKYILKIQGLLELSVLLFFYGVYAGNEAIWILGGVLMLIDDVIAMALGVLNPIAPIMLAIIFAIFIQPWYLALFWSIAVFAVLGIPGAFVKLFMTPKVESSEKTIDRLAKDLES